MSATWNFGEFYARKAAWSKETFGPAQTTAGVAAHMRKELDELRVSIANPGRKCGEIDAIREELSDICLLAIELSWRGGGDASDFGEIVGERDSMSIASAATYVGLHLDAICRGVMGARAGAVVIWDIAFRALGCDPAPILQKFEALQTRTWPDWRTVPADQPIEHVREVDPTEEWMKREFERSTNSTPAVLIEEKPMPISRDAYEARLIAKCDRLKEEITKLTTERDDERALREINQQEICGLSAQLASPSMFEEGGKETWKARIERVATESAGYEEQIAKLTADRDDLETENEHLREAIRLTGWGEVEDAKTAVLRVVDERDALLAGRTELLRRCDETLESSRVLTAERDRIRYERDSLIAWSAPPDWKPLLQALGMDGGFPSFAALVERAGQLRDDSVSYCSLRGRLVGLIGGGNTFSDGEILDALADGLESPVNDSTLDVEEVVAGLEEDITTLKAALHVATRGRP